MQPSESSRFLLRKVRLKIVAILYAGQHGRPQRRRSAEDRIFFHRRRFGNTQEMKERRRNGRQRDPLWMLHMAARRVSYPEHSIWMVHAALHPFDLVEQTVEFADSACLG